MDISSRLSTIVMASKVNMGSFWVTGVKSWFSLNASSALCHEVYQCISIRLTPLQTLLAQISIWGRKGQKVIFTKNALLQITWQYQVTHAYPSSRYPLQNLSAQIFYQTWSKWSVSLPLLTQTRVVSEVTMGSLGSKKSFSPKGMKSYRKPIIDAWLMHMHSLDPLYESYSPKIFPGSTRVTGVKGHFHLKSIKSYRIRSIDVWLSHMQYIQSLYKVMILNLIRGHFGSQGSKCHFH